MPIHKDFHPMLDGMTEQYCTGESEETSKTETAEGYPGKTCRKALSVFYATCKEKDLDYSQSMPREKVREHVQAILPFKILEKIVDKPLRIRGVAMTAGMSRNFNIYTPEELQNFANKLVSAPVYVEHVAVPNACGKVTKTEWDGQNLWYEAEIFEGDIADKIRKGLIQHVSVGADYDVLDVADGQIPHGLHNAELSLVAVPGIPETNVQILESLQRAKEQQENCVFCGKNPVEFWLGCCSECFEKLPIAESKRQKLLQKRKTREQQDVVPAGVSAGQNMPRGVENMNEEDLKKFVDEQVNKALKEQGEVSEVKAKLAETESKPAEAEKTVENLKPPGGLVKDPPKTMQIEEAVEILEGLLPSPAVERSTMGMQRECQAIRCEVLKLKERLKSG